MKQFIIVLTLLCLLPVSAFAEIKTVTHTLKQPFGGSQSPDDARIAGIHKAKREALEQFGTYIESTTVVKNAQVDSDEILALTAGVTKAEVIKQKNYADGDAFGIEITVKVELDSAVLESSLKKLIKDRTHLKDLKEAQKREQKLLARIAELEKENQMKGNTEQQTAELKEKFHAASRGLTAYDLFSKATSLPLWDGQEYTDPTKTVDYLTQSIRIDPNYVPAYLFRAGVYIHLNQFELAIADCDQAIRLAPNYASAYSRRGRAYAALEQFNRAIADYDQAINLMPSDAGAYSGRGRAYAALEQFNRAIVDYDQAIRLMPDNEWKYIVRGDTYFQLMQYAPAIADYDHAIRLNPNNAEPYFMRGTVYKKLGQFDRAITDYDNVIRLNPNRAYIYSFRADSYVNLKQDDQAISDYTHAINQDSKSQYVAYDYVSRGNAYLRLNRTQEACYDLENACKLGVCYGYESARRNLICK